jgi:HK97 family phage prohead protease
MNKFMAWLTSTDTPSTKFSDADGPDYKPLSVIIDQALLGGGTVTRENALRIMPVLKGRNMICNIATLPLVLLNADRKAVSDPLFDQFDPQVANVVHLAMTIEDLLFDGIAWWEVIERWPLGRPRHVRRVDSRRVSTSPPRNRVNNPLPSGMDPNAVLYVDGKPKSAYEYIRFDSPNPPFLMAARDALMRISLLEKAAAMYADNPSPSDYFTPANGYEPEDDNAVETALRQWVASRKKRSTGYVPSTLEYHTVQAPTPHELQLVELQEKATLDLANGLSIDPEDLGVSTTSRTYQNATDRRQDRVNDVLSGFMKAITDRLTMPDITKNKHRAAFRLDDYMRADPKTRWETHKIAAELGATDIAEIREDEDWENRPDLNEAKEPEPAEAAPVEQEESLMDHKVLATFSAPAEVKASQTFRFDGDAMTFAADSEKRTITGTILLYGVAADNGYGKFTFAEGALEWNKSAVSRVKFLRDHDWKSLLGHATVITSDTKKAAATFKVARGAQGDEALTLAEDGALDGLSVGIDIVEWTDDKDGNFTVTKAILNEVSLTPRPAFEDARLTKVTASKKDTPKENTVPEDQKPDAPATPDVSALVAEAVAAAFAKAKADDEAKAAEATKAAELSKDEAKATAKADEDKATKAAELSKKDEDEAVKPINSAGAPTPGVSFEVKEKSPYTFDAKGRFAAGEHDFSTDVVAMLKANDQDGTKTEFGKRVMAHIQENFAVATGDVDELNPAVNRPQDYYETRAPRTPLWDLVNKGALPEGVKPFVMPKFASASGLVGDHTQGVEPTPGTFVTTSQTITPSAVSGKVTINREVWDLGGNPAVSNLIWNRMVREYYQALETSTAAFLATLTAAADITLSPVGAADGVLASALQAAMVELQFADQYEFSAFAVEKILYAALSAAKDTTGRPLFPAIGASNANGQVGNLFQTLNVNGLRAVPAAKLPSVAASPNKSYLFDPEVVFGYASAPQRLEFAGSTQTPAANSYGPVAGIDLAIWGYKAFANTDIGGVREVIYDNA